MGQRASVMACVRPGCVADEGDTTVRIQKPCGNFEEVASPCVASNIMRKHPEYLVVHCSQARCGAVNISVIRPNQDLLPGVPYMLFPKVESTELAEVSNLPASICMSVEGRQLTFRSSTSPNGSKTSSTTNDGEKSVV